MSVGHKATLNGGPTLERLIARKKRLELALSQLAPEAVAKREELTGTLAEINSQLQQVLEAVGHALKPSPAVEVVTAADVGDVSAADLSEV